MINFMQTTLFLKSKHRIIQEDITKIKANDLINSKDFWIYLIYFFLSFSLLMAVHMYEYLKCFLC